MALQIRRGTSTNPTLAEGELYLNTTTGVLYTLIGEVVTAINANSANRSKKIYLNLVNTGAGPFDDWTGSSIVYSDDEDIAGANITVSFVGDGIINVAFDPALAPDASMSSAQIRPLMSFKSGSDLIYFEYTYTVSDGLILTFYDDTLTTLDMEIVARDIILVLDYLEALPS